MSETNRSYDSPGGAGGIVMCYPRFDRSAAVWTAIIASVAMAQPDPVWIHQFGSAANDIAEAMTPDGAGGAFLAVTTSGDLGGPPLGGTDIALARLDVDGLPNWVTRFGTSKSDTARTLAPDGSGGVFLAGFTPGDLAGPALGGVDAFLARFDGEGQRLWAVQFGTELDDHAHAAESDGAGGVFIAGTTYGDLGGPNAGQRDCTLARFDSAGARLWAVQFGTGVHDVAVAAAPDGAGGVFIGGRTGGSLGGPKLGKYDAFLARYDADGNRLWITQYGTAQSDGIFALATDGAGGVWAAGETYGDLAAPQAGVADIFIAHHNSAGERTFLSQFGSGALDFPTAIAPDGMGGAFVAGDTDGDLAGPSAGTTDAFLMRIDGAGGTRWITQFGTQEIDGLARSIATIGPGRVIIAGETLGDLAAPNLGGWDMLLARYDDSCGADINGDGVLDLFDFLEFVNLFGSEDPAADCDASGDLDVFDLLCFTNRFNEGC